MIKFSLDEDEIHKFMLDLNINIGNHSTVTSVHIEDNIQYYAERYCQTVDQDIIRFVTLCVQDSYFLALKTFEESLKKTLLPDFDFSDDIDDTE